MTRPPLAATVALALLAGAALVPAAASPQPTPVCPACGTQFEQAADERGVDVTVQSSRVLVQVHENGSATWTVRNRLNSTGDFRDDPDAFDATARELVTDAYGPPEDATFRDARLEGDLAVVVFHDPDAADRHAGLLVVDYLHDDSGRPLYHLNADVFRVRGPIGTVVTNTPTGAVEDGRTATWTGSTAGDYYAEGPDLEGSPYVALGPPSARGLRTDAALALATLPIVAGALQQFVIVQTLLFGGVLAAITVLLRPREFERGPATYGPVLAVAGLLGLVAPVAVNGPDWVSVPALAALLVGSAAAVPAVRTRRWTPLRLAAAAAVVLTLASGAVFAIQVAIDGYAPRVATAESLALALPFAACLPLGAALDAGRQRMLAWGAVAVAGFVVAALTLVNPVDPPTGLGGGLLTFFLAGLAVAAPLVGSLVLAVGRTLAGSSPSAATGP